MDAPALGYQAHLPASVCIGGRDFDCRAETLGLSGILLVGRFPPCVEAEATVTVRTPAGDLSARLTGRVVFARRETEPDENRLALEFEQLDTAQTAALQSLVDRVVGGMAPAVLDGLGATASTGEVRAALDRIPLAHRVAMAGRAGPKERRWLRQDRDPTVLEGLARNPHVTLPEVKDILRRNDVPPQTIDRISTDPRWYGDDEIKWMICTHPRVSFPTADRVVQRMTDLQIDQLVRRTGLHPGVRQKLMHRLSLKHRG